MSRSGSSQGGHLTFKVTTDTSQYSLLREGEFSINIERLYQVEYAFKAISNQV